MLAAVETPSTTAVRSRFVWFDLMSTDRGASLAFFRDLLDWTPSATGAGSSGAYLTLSAGGVPFGGAVDMSPDEGHPSHFIGYVACDDIDDVAARAHGLGGAVAYPPLDVPAVGRLAALSDPMGAPFSAMTPVPGTPRAPESDVPVGCVAWSEVVSNDPRRIGDFYARLFGWTIRPQSGAGAEDCTLLTHGGATVAGLARAVHDDLPSGWLFHLRVADIDSAVARVPDLGGTVLTGVVTIPQGRRCAVVREPSGATFALLQGRPTS